MKLKLAKGKTADVAYSKENGTSPDGYVNHGIKLITKLVETCAGKEIEWYHRFNILLL